MAISFMPYARIIKNVRTKCMIFDEALRIGVQKLKQNLQENYSKQSTKIASIACKFLKIFGGSLPPYLLRAFLVSQSASN